MLSVSLFEFEYPGSPCLTQQNYFLDFLDTDKGRDNELDSQRLYNVRYSIIHNFALIPPPVKQLCLTKLTLI